MNRLLKYYRFFDYAPTLDQYFLFQRGKVDKEELVKLLKNDPRFTINDLRVAYIEDVDLIVESEKRSIISQQKLKSKKSFLHLLGYIPFVQFVGVSGSVAAENAKEDDDVDVFIISKAGWLWTARFIILLVSSLFGIRRYPKDSNYKDKLCFNLFFDESDLTIPKDKQTEYVGHEVLQVAQVVNKCQTYERFLKANEWVAQLFPNVKFQFTNSKFQTSTKFQIPNLVEFFLKIIQLFIMNRNRTTERITNTQLWFFPNDFEKRMVK